MEPGRLEKELKDELQRLERTLRQKETLRLAGWIGSIVGGGLALSSMAHHIPIIAAIAVAGTLMNIVATRLVSRKK